MCITVDGGKFQRAKAANKKKIERTGQRGSIKDGTCERERERGAPEKRERDVKQRESGEKNNLDFCGCGDADVAVFGGGKSLSLCFTF